MFQTNFPHEAGELSAFTFSLDTFIISLKDGKVVKHRPVDNEQFYEWLVNNKVREIGKRRVPNEMLA